MNDGNWSITRLFPRFGAEQLSEFHAECSADERATLDEMFEVVEVIDARGDVEYVVSTSLYCRPHSPGLPRIDPVTEENLRIPHPGVRNGESWWDTYLRPLIRELDCVQPPWILRIHLAAELSFLIPHLRHPRVEFWIMKHPSENTVPGMFWRYLPLEDGVHLVARGADLLWPDLDYWKHALRTFHGPCRFFRAFCPRDMSTGKLLTYRTMPGPLVVRGGLPLPYIEHAKAWIWFQRRRKWPKSACLPWVGEELPKFGLGHWAKYGQDEQFLSHWLYFIACEEGLDTLIYRGNRSKIFCYDRQFAEASNVHSTVVKWFTEA